MQRTKRCRGRMLDSTWDMQALGVAWGVVQALIIRHATVLCAFGRCRGLPVCESCFVKPSIADVQGQGYHQTCEVFQKNPRGRTLSSLYNHNVAHFGRLLLNVLNWGDTVRSHC